MSRIRLNQEYRNKGGKIVCEYTWNKRTHKKKNFSFKREKILKLHQDKTWELAKVCVTRQYPKEDVQMAHYLQDKYPNVNTIAKDSCFHFGYMGKPEEKDEEDKYII